MSCLLRFHKQIHIEKFPNMTALSLVPEPSCTRTQYTIICLVFPEVMSIGLLFYSNSNTDEISNDLEH